MGTKHRTKTKKVKNTIQKTKTMSNTDPFKNGGEGGGGGYEPRRPPCLKISIYYKFCIFYLQNDASPVLLSIRTWATQTLSSTKKPMNDSRWRWRVSISWEREVVYVFFIYLNFIAVWVVLFLLGLYHVIINVYWEVRVCSMRLGW